MTLPPREDSPSSLEILLATYNGAAHLPDLLDSVFAQDDQDFTLRVRDDGSGDTTLDVLEDYRYKFGDRMIIESDSAPTGSAGATSRC